MRKLDVVEFLKGYSIFTIIIFHFLQTLALPSPFDQLISFGGTGVHLFVLLSGFGLYFSYLHKPLPYAVYLQKRVSKIYIPYILVVIIAALISVFIPLYENSWYALGGHVLLYKMFDENIIASYGYPLWFVSMILQFYVVFYLLIFLLKKTDKVAFIILCTASSILWMALVLYIGEASARTWNSFFLRYVWEFGLGMVIAATFTESNYELPVRIKPAYLFIIGILNCALYAFLALEAGALGRMANDIPALTGYAVLAVWIFSLNIRPVNAFLIFSGRISFSLYLLHYSILYVALFLENTIPLSVILIAAFVATYIAAVYYDRAITRLYALLKV